MLIGPGINLHGADIGMAEQIANVNQIYAGLQKVHGLAVLRQCSEMVPGSEELPVCCAINRYFLRI